MSAGPDDDGIATHGAMIATHDARTGPPHPGPSHSEQPPVVLATSR